jgi:hypothetical protein
LLGVCLSTGIGAVVFTSFFCLFPFRLSLHFKAPFFLGILIKLGVPKTNFK